MRHECQLLWPAALVTCLLGLSSAVYPAARPISTSYGKSASSRTKFVPAEPGETPSCVKNPRLTYCTDPDDYPKDRIIYLLENNMFDLSTILMDETRDTYTFEAMDAPKPMYGYQAPKQGYLPPTVSSYGGGNSSMMQYGPPKNNNNYYSQRPSVSKYGPPRQQQYPSRFVAVHNNTTSPSSSYASYLPPQSFPSPSSYNSYFGRRSISSPSIGSNVYSKAPSSSYRSLGDHDDDDPIYPGGYQKAFSTSLFPTRDTGSHRSNPPQKSHVWWRKVGNNSSRRYKRQTADGDDASDLCPSRASYIMPRAAQNIGGDWMYLVNLEDVNPRYTQLVRSEICIQNQCTGACQAPPGSVAVCQQQFAQKRLVALSGTGERLNQDIFWFPSCCVCKIRRP